MIQRMCNERVPSQVIMFQEGLITDDEGEAVFLGFDSPQEEDDTVLGFDFKEEDDYEPINEVSFFLYIS